MRKGGPTKNLKINKREWGLLFGTGEYLIVKKVFRMTVIRMVII